MIQGLVKRFPPHNGARQTGLEFISRAILFDTTLSYENAYILLIPLQILYSGSF